MTGTDAIELTRGWPEDRSVPHRLREMYDTATGQDREQIGTTIESLIVSSVTLADIELVQKYFGS